jgi:hypothetical protein
MEDMPARTVRVAAMLAFASGVAIAVLIPRRLQAVR